MFNWLTILGLSLLGASHVAPTAPPIAVQDASIRASAKASRSRQPRSSRNGGMYGRDAVGIWNRVAGNDRVFQTSSPGGRSQMRARWVEARIEGKEEPIILDLSGRIGRHRVRLVPGVGTEVLWAPTGDALMLTTSSGGLNGIYDLILVDRVQGVTRERNISEVVRRRFGRPVRCDFPELQNVAGIAWLPNGNMLVAAEIVHHSVCDGLGTIKVYEVSPTDARIVREYDQVEARRRFHHLLGWEIVDASDWCVVHPDQCLVALGYHVE